MNRGFLDPSSTSKIALVKLLVLMILLLARLPLLLPAMVEAMVLVWQDFCLFRVDFKSILGLQFIFSGFFNLFFNKLLYDKIRI